MAAAGRVRRRRGWRAVFGTFVVLAAGIAAAGAAVQPSHERAWRDEQAVLPHVAWDGDVVHIRNVRSFTWRSATDPERAYVDRSYDLARLQTVWYVLSPFGRDWRGPAHSFLSFGFDDGRYVAVSVEARREQGEEYSILKGALRRFELMYIIGEERDLIGLRAVTWDDPVYVYPIRATPEQARAVFVNMLERAASLERRPEFYNTFTNNCTTNILDQVNRVATRRIPFGAGILLPGYSDRVAHRRGLIDTDLPLDLARERFFVNDRAKAAIDDPDFSRLIRS